MIRDGIWWRWLKNKGEGVCENWELKIEKDQVGIVIVWVGGEMWMWMYVYICLRLFLCGKCHC